MTPPYRCLPKANPFQPHKQTHSVSKDKASFKSYLNIDSTLIAYWVELYIPIAKYVIISYRVLE